MYLYYACNLVWFFRQQCDRSSTTNKINYIEQHAVENNTHTTKIPHHAHVHSHKVWQNTDLNNLSICASTPNGRFLHFSFENTSKWWQLWHRESKALKSISVFFSTSYPPVFLSKAGNKFINFQELFFGHWQACRCLIHTRGQ